MHIKLKWKKGLLFAKLVWSVKPVNQTQPLGLAHIRTPGLDSNRSKPFCPHVNMSVAGYQYANTCIIIPSGFLLTLCRPPGLSRSRLVSPGLPITPCPFSNNLRIYFEMVIAPYSLIGEWMPVILNTSGTKCGVYGNRVLQEWSGNSEWCRTFALIKELTIELSFNLM